ncbi:hypothetical protein JTB14_036785 [Gonioctena quinquepunctata]|nr:hypothetical protein JTB14_036785 [Gonioctena quinquepunctata]
MERKFKCCKKDFGNLFCITCCDIFHPSCLDRKTKYKELGSFKIYCSQNCELKDAERKQDADKLVNDIKKLKNDVSQRDETINKLEYEKDEKITELMKRIDELEKDTKEREAAYIRARKKTQDFEDEVYETEILYNTNQCLFLECNNILRRSNYYGDGIRLTNASKFFLGKALLSSVKGLPTSGNCESEQPEFKNNQIYRGVFPDFFLINEGTAGTTTSSVPSEAEVEETSKTKLKKMAFSIPKESSSGVSPSDTSFRGKKSVSDNIASNHS